jgi:hypothetical protein
MQRPGTRVAFSLLVAGCASFLVAGFPFLLVAAQGSSAPAQTGAVIAALTLGRAPLLVPAVPLTALLMRRTAAMGASSKLRRFGALGLIALPVFVAGSYLLGPAVVRLVFGSDFVVSPAFMAWVAVSAALILVLMLTGTLLLATARHAASAVGWVTAVGVSVLALGLSGDVEVRTAFALVLGPLAGLLVHGLCVVKGGPRFSAIDSRVVD